MNMKTHEYNRAGDKVYKILDADWFNAIHKILTIIITMLATYLVTTVNNNNLSMAKMQVEMREVKENIKNTSSTSYDNVDAQKDLALRDAAIANLTTLFQITNTEIKDIKNRVRDLEKISYKRK